MKDDINLLPPRVIRRRRQWLSLKRAGSLVLRVVLFEVVLVNLVAAGIAANVKLGQLVSQEQADAAAKQAEVQSKAREINAFMSDLDKWRVKYREWMPVTTKVLGAAPAGVLVSDIQAGSDGRILIQGVFDRPDQIAAYQRALLQLEGIKEVEVPLSNYATAGNARFRLEIIQ